MNVTRGLAATSSVPSHAASQHISSSIPESLTLNSTCSNIRQYKRVTERLDTCCRLLSHVHSSPRVQEILSTEGFAKGSSSLVCLCACCKPTQMFFTSWSDTGIFFGGDTYSCKGNSQRLHAWCWQYRWWVTLPPPFHTTPPKLGFEKHHPRKILIQKVFERKACLQTP